MANLVAKHADRWSIQDAQAVLARLERSGLSVQEFAAREGLLAERLYRWRRRLSSSDRAKFVEITVPREPAGRVEVELRSGVVVRFPEAADLETVARFVERLEGRGGC